MAGACRNQPPRKKISFRVIRGTSFQALKNREVPEGDEPHFAAFERLPRFEAARCDERPRRMMLTDEGPQSGRVTTGAIPVGWPTAAPPGGQGKRHYMRGSPPGSAGSTRG